MSETINRAFPLIDDLEVLYIFQMERPLKIGIQEMQEMFYYSPVMAKRSYFLQSNFTSNDVEELVRFRSSPYYSFFHQMEITASRLIHSGDMQHPSSVSPGISYMVQYLVPRSLYVQHADCVTRGLAVMYNNENVVELQKHISSRPLLGAVLDKYNNTEYNYVDTMLGSVNISSWSLNMKPTYHTAHDIDTKWDGWKEMVSGIYLQNVEVSQKNLCEQTRTVLKESLYMLERFTWDSPNASAIVQEYESCMHTCIKKITLIVEEHRSSMTSFRYNQLKEHLVRRLWEAVVIPTWIYTVSSETDPSEIVGNYARLSSIKQRLCSAQMVT